jgi:hypothetical protein
MSEVWVEMRGLERARTAPPPRSWDENPARRRQETTRGTEYSPSATSPQSGGERSGGTSAGGQAGSCAATTAPRHASFGCFLADPTRSFPPYWSWSLDGEPGLQRVCGGTETVGVHVDIHPRARASVRSRTRARTPLRVVTIYISMWLYFRRNLGRRGTYFWYCSYISYTCLTSCIVLEMITMVLHIIHFITVLLPVHVLWSVVLHVDWRCIHFITVSITSVYL